MVVSDVLNFFNVLNSIIRLLCVNRMQGDNVPFVIQNHIRFNSDALVIHKLRAARGVVPALLIPLHDSILFIQRISSKPQTVQFASVFCV